MFPSGEETTDERLHLVRSMEDVVIGESHTLEPQPFQREVTSTVLADEVAAMEREPICLDDESVANEKVDPTNSPNRNLRCELDAHAPKNEPQCRFNARFGTWRYRSR